MSFINEQSPTSAVLVILPELYKKKISGKIASNVNSTFDIIELPELPELVEFERCIWATERVDRNALIAHTLFAPKEK